MLFLSSQQSCTSRAHGRRSGYARASFPKHSIKTTKGEDVDGLGERWLFGTSRSSAFVRACSRAKRRGRVSVPFFVGRSGRACSRSRAKRRRPERGNASRRRACVRVRGNAAYRSPTASAMSARSSSMPMPFSEDVMTTGFDFHAPLQWF